MVSRKHPLPDFLQKQIILDNYMEERPLHELRCWLFRRSFEEVKRRAKKSPELKMTSNWKYERKILDQSQFSFKCF